MACPHVPHPDSRSTSPLGCRRTIRRCWCTSTSSAPTRPADLARHSAWARRRCRRRSAPRVARLPRPAARATDGRAIELRLTARRGERHAGDLGARSGPRARAAGDAVGGRARPAVAGIELLATASAQRRRRVTAPNARRPDCSSRRSLHARNGCCSSCSRWSRLVALVRSSAISCRRTTSRRDRRATRSRPRRCSTRSAMWRAAASWRTDLRAESSCCRRSTGRVRFREEGSSGSLTMEIVEATRPTRMVTRIADPDQPFGGTWTFELVPDGGRHAARRSPSAARSTT